MKRVTLIASLGVFAVITSTLPALAQSSPIELTVRCHREKQQINLQDPRPTVSISREQIIESAPSSLADSLRRSPSVSVQQTTPGQGSIYVRGLSGRALAHIVDGVRLNSSIFRDGNNPYLGLVDVYSLDRIQVEPGAASVHYGSDALAGAVVMHTPLPSYRLSEPLTTLHVYQSLASNPLGSVSRVSLTHSSSRVSLNAGLTWLQNGPIHPGRSRLSPAPDSYTGLERKPGEAYRPELNSEQIGTEFSSYAGNGTLRLRLGSGTDLVVRAQGMLEPTLVRYDQVTPRFKNEFPARSEMELSPMYRTMLGLELVNRSRTRFYDVARVALSWQRLSERSVRRDLDETCLLNGLPAEESAACTSFRLDRSARRTLEHNRSDAFGMLAQFESENADRTRGARAGISVLHDVVSSRSERISIPESIETKVDERFPNGSSQTELGAFASFDVRPLTQLTLSAGARASAFMLDIAERKGANPVDGFKRTAFDYSGSAGAAWRLIPSLAFVANFGRGLRMPNVQDFSTLGPRAGGRFQLPNPSINPEHSYNVDSGFKFAWGKHRAQTSVFFLRYDDVLELAPTTLSGAQATADGDLYYRTVNAGSLEFWGIESYFDVALTNNTAVFGRLLAMLGNQYNSPGTGLPAQTPADRVPPAQGELGVRFCPTERLTLEVFTSARAAQRRLNDPINLEDNRIPEGGTPGYVTYHARGQYRFSRSVLTRLSLDNITDELVLEHGSGFYRSGFAATASIDAKLE